MRDRPDSPSDAAKEQTTREGERPVEPAPDKRTRDPGPDFVSPRAWVSKRSRSTEAFTAGIRDEVF